MTTVLGVPQISQELLEDLDRVGRKYARWTVPAYLELGGNYLVEFVRGRLEILPMPTMRHQVLASRMYDAVRGAAPPQGLVLFAGTRVKVAEDAFREPDVLYIPPELRPTARNEYAERVALVVEVVSESNRDHDLETKRAEYADAGIPEYWIVDPEERQVTVLTLRGDGYATHGLFEDGSVATSLMLPGLKVDVAALFAA
jgi:Uma2 family endonuclease